MLRRRLDAISVSYFLLLPFICAVARIRAPCKRSLNRRSRFGGDVEFGEFGSYLKDVHAGCVEDLFGRRDGDCEVCVFGETCYEEHEATRFDLHFCKVCTTGRNVCVFPVREKSISQVLNGWLVGGQVRTPCSVYASSGCLRCARTGP